MKILLVTQEFPPHVLGGVGYHAYHLAAALADRGHAVHVLTGASGDHVADDSLPARPDVAVSTIEYPRRVAPRLWFARRARRWLASWDRLEEFDVVHAHEYLDFDRLDFGGSTIQKVHFNLTEKPRYLSLEGVPGPVERGAFALARTTIWRAERRLERRAIESADVTIANSRLTRSLCLRRHPVEEDAIEVVYNGVDVDRFTPSETAANDALLFVGGDSTRKGFDALLDAIRELGAGRDVTITVVGAVDSVDTTTLASTLPVEFLGRVSQGELAALYRNAAALVHPALYEPFGNVVLEAFACGTPVVVSNSDHCGAAELVDDETGIDVDPSAPAAVAAAMRTAARSPSRFSSQECRAVAETYTWDRVAERTIEIAQGKR